MDPSDVYTRVLACKQSKLSQFSRLNFLHANGKCHRNAFATFTATVSQLSGSLSFARSPHPYTLFLQAITGRALRASPGERVGGSPVASAPSHPKVNPNATLGLVLNVLSEYATNSMADATYNLVSHELL
jgi:hypothetical protein